MPSSDPFEMMIETFSIGAGAVSVMSPTSSDAAARLGDAGDPCGDLRRALGEQLVQLLDAHPGGLAEHADRRSGPLLEVLVAHEVDDLPVVGRQLVDPFAAGDLG